MAVVNRLNEILEWDGLKGRVTATIMSAGDADMERAAVVRADPDGSAHALVIGCGPGVGVVALARRLTQGRVIAVDPSAVMVERTLMRTRNARLESLFRWRALALNSPRHAATFAYTTDPGVIGRLTRTVQLFGRALPAHEAAERDRFRADAMIH